MDSNALTILGLAIAGSSLLITALGLWLKR